MSNISDILKELSQAVGVCGEEDFQAAKTVKKLMESYCKNIEIDAMNSVLCTVKEPKDGQPLVMLDAHLDEIGLMVTHIDDNGFLKVASCGGVDYRMILGRSVTVHAKEPVKGIVVCVEQDSKKIPDADKVRIDTGMSGEYAREIILPGDKITIDAPYTELLSSNVTSRAFDDRAGCAVVVRAVQLLSEMNLDCGVAAVFSVQEENGCRGAMTATFKTEPTHAIVTDVSFGHTPDAPKDKCGVMGKGPMIGISPVLDIKLSRLMEKTAKENDIPYQLEVMGGSTGTNSDNISVSRYGVKTGLISIPLRYMHSPVEVVSLNDVENCAKLMAETVCSIAKGGKEAL